jgi:hypothetical protein
MRERRDIIRQSKRNKMRNKRRIRTLNRNKKIIRTAEGSNKGREVQPLKLIKILCSDLLFR